MGICYAALGMLTEEVTTSVVHFSEVCNILEDSPIVNKLNLLVLMRSKKVKSETLTLF
jgi:hypothetical protein